MTDKLTGVHNRSKLDEILRIEIDRAKRYDKNFWLRYCGYRLFQKGE